MSLKIHYGAKVYAKLSEEDRARLRAVSCDCYELEAFDPDCEICEGGGVIWEDIPDEATARAIEDNFRSQGIPLGRDGTN